MKADSGPIRALFAASECAPWVKTGGLGDICASLPLALRGTGIDVRVLLPAYPAILGALPDASPLADLAGADALPPARLLDAGSPGGVPLVLVDCPPLYARPGGPYQDAGRHDWADNVLRFGLLSRVAALLGGDASPIGWRADIVHCNDWQTALAPAYLRFLENAPARTLVTVHNLAFQGIFPPHLLTDLGLPPRSFSIHGLEFHGSISFLKAGLYYADAITTVSPTYAREIQSEPLGFGLHGLLAARRDVLHGILNGIDTDHWNPATDPHLACNYDASTLERKRRNTAALRVRLGLERDATAPVAGVVSRLTEQKGSDLVAAVAPRLIEEGVQLAVLGSGEPEHEAALLDVALRHPGRCAVVIGFDEPLAHLIEGGSDLFLMPSRFEPCGMNQMYSQRYGTPPIVHATGGLVDSVVDADAATLADRTATGFRFDASTPGDLFAAIERALALRGDVRAWRRLQRRGMARDFGWSAAAGRYAALYRRLVEPASALAAT